MQGFLDPAAYPSNRLLERCLHGHGCVTRTPRPTNADLARDPHPCALGGVAGGWVTDLVGCRKGDFRNGRNDCGHEKFRRYW